MWCLRVFLREKNNFELKLIVIYDFELVKNSQPHKKLATWRYFGDLNLEGLKHDFQFISIGALGWDNWAGLKLSRGTHPKRFLERSQCQDCFKPDQPTWHMFCAQCWHQYWKAMESGNADQQRIKMRKTEAGMTAPELTDDDQSTTGS